MLYTQIWFLPNITTKPHPAPLEPIHNIYTPPFSIAYFCPLRGEIWARRLCLDELGNPTRWTIYVVTHPDEPHEYICFWPAGTLLTAIREEMWSTIPASILAREFLLYAEWLGLDKLKTMGND